MNAMSKQQSAETAWYAHVQGFSRDRLRSALRLQSIAWAVAIGGGLIAGAEGFAIAKLATRPMPDPVVLRVADADGVPERIFTVNGGSMSATEAEQRYWAWLFVRMAESYMPPGPGIDPQHSPAAQNFHAVALMSTPAVQKWQFERTRGSNPASPQAVLGRDGQSDLTWVGTSFDGPGIVRVRFRQEDRKGGALIAKRHMVATIVFTFTRAAISWEDININSRGFLVTSYSVDPEAT